MKVTRIQPIKRFTGFVCGYCMVRLGKKAEGRLSLAKVVELDARDRFGAKRLVEIVDKGAENDDAADA